MALVDNGVSLPVGGHRGGASMLAPMEGGPNGRASTSAQQEKRSFKSKLHSMIQEAEAAEVQALREAQLQDKKSLSIAILTEGRPEAYVDFFKLTHSALQPPPPQQQQQQGSEEGTSGHEDAEIPQESLALLRAQLVKADSASRAGETQEVYSAYKNLAKYFAQLGRLRKAEYFFKRCLQISKEAKWLPGELEANLALGIVYEELNDTASAITCHEKRLELAIENVMTSETETAYHSLTAVYLRQAEKQQQGGDLQGAIESYNHCLVAADKASDFPTAARANFHMGMLYHQQEKWPESMYYLGKFIDLSRHVNDKAMEGVAHTTYAQCRQEVGDVDGAMHALEQYLDIARGVDPQGPAVACCSLGILYYGQGRFDQAMTYFEKFFEIARTLGNRRIMDTARVNLGIARGAFRLKHYYGVVNNDLTKLIQWKNARVHFPESD